MNMKILVVGVPAAEYFRSIVHPSRAFFSTFEEILFFMNYWPFERQIVPMEVDTYIFLMCFFYDDTIEAVILFRLSPSPVVSLYVFGFLWQQGNHK